MKCTLDRAGFVVNVAKSMLRPAQQGQWLGFQLDLALGELSVPPQKIEALKSLLAQAVKAVDLPARRMCVCVCVYVYVYACVCMCMCIVCTYTITLYVLVITHSGGMYIGIYL